MSMLDTVNGPDSSGVAEEQGASAAQSPEQKLTALLISDLGLSEFDAKVLTEGLSRDQTAKLLAYLQGNPKVTVEGLMSGLGLSKEEALKLTGGETKPVSLYGLPLSSSALLMMALYDSNAVQSREELFSLFKELHKIAKKSHDKMIASGITNMVGGLAQAGFGGVMAYRGGKAASAEKSDNDVSNPWDGNVIAASIGTQAIGTVTQGISTLFSADAQFIETDEDPVRTAMHTASGQDEENRQRSHESAQALGPK